MALPLAALLVPGGSPAFLIGFRLLGLSDLIGNVTKAEGGGLMNDMAGRMERLLEDIAGRAQFYVTGSRDSLPDDRLGSGRSGKLRGGIKALPVRKTKNDLVGVVSTSKVVYARIHEFGGVIVPRRARFLVFETRSGETVFTKRVVMPRRPYMARAFKDFEPQIAKELGKAFKSSIEGGK